MAIDIKTDELPLAAKVQDGDFLIKQNIGGDTTRITVDNFAEYIFKQAAQLKIAEPTDDTLFVSTEKGATEINKTYLAEIINCMKVLLKDVPVVDKLVSSMGLLCTTGEDIKSLSLEDLDKYMQAQWMEDAKHADKLDPSLNSDDGTIDEDEYEIQQIYDHMSRPVLDKTFFIRYPQKGETTTIGSNSYYKYYAVVPSATSNSKQEYFYMARGVGELIGQSGVLGYNGKREGLKMGVATAGTKILIGLAYIDYPSMGASSESKTYEATPQYFWALPTKEW